MKRLYTLIVTLLLSVSLFAQIPEKMTYQAVVRNSSDQLVTEQAVQMRISILQGSESGSSVYTETHTETTNANGLLSVEIGTGTTTDDFTSIDWSNGPYFLKTEVDPAGGTSYSITGTSQILSVPYALHAKTAENLTSPPTSNRVISIPAYALAISDFEGIIQPVRSGLNWQQNYRAPASFAIKKPSAYDGGDVTMSIYFSTTTATEGVVDFFIRPTSYNSGEGLFDPGSIGSEAGVEVSGKAGFGTVYEEQITIPADRLEKDWWYTSIQRQGSSSTYTDDVVLISVALSY